MRIVPDKGRYSCKFRKISKFFSRIFAKISSVCQNCCILAAQRKTSLKKIFFKKKTRFFRSFPTFYQNFQDFPPTFFIRVVKGAFSVSRRTLPRKLDFLLKEFYLKHFPESARTTIGPTSNFFSVGTSKLRSRSQEHISEGNFLKKSFLKISNRLWGEFLRLLWKFCSSFLKAEF